MRSTLIALRLTEENRHVVRAAALGPLLSLAEMGRAAARTAPRRGGGGPGAGDALDVVAAEWTRVLALILGFDPTSAAGRTRLDVALMLYHLAHTRFDG